MVFCYELEQTKTIFLFVLTIKEETFTSKRRLAVGKDRDLVGFV